VRHVWLAGRTLLAVMSLDGDVEGAIDPGEVGIRVMLGD
jgi:hypothetical protein